MSSGPSDQKDDYDAFIEELERTGFFKITPKLKQVMRNRRLNCKAAFYNLTEKEIDDIAYDLFFGEIYVVRFMVKCFTTELNRAYNIKEDVNEEK